MPELPLSEYELMYRLEESFWWYAGMREITRAVFSRLGMERGGGLQVLDVGCGTGYNLKFLSAYGDAFGIELSGEALKFSAQRNIGNACQAEALSLPFKDESFDLVCCFDVLEYIPEDSRALDEVFRVLRKGGRAYIRDAAFMWLYGRHDRSSGIIRRYSSRSLSASISKAGFEVVLKTYSNFLLFMLIAFIRLFMEHILPESEHPRSDVYLSPGFLNRPLTWILKLEAGILKNFSLPLGTSVIVMARKP